MKVTVDTVIFTIRNNGLYILLVQRLIEPFKGVRAIPGGFVLDEESTEQAAVRELFEETGVRNNYMEQLYTFSNPKRDPRERVITVTYMATMRYKKDPTPGSDAQDSKFFAIKQLPQLAFDHSEIIRYAYKRLIAKMEYTNIAQHFLPELFSLHELQKIYEIILGRKFDTRNFRKKIAALKLVKETHRVETDVPHRPAKLYTFASQELQIVPGTII